MIKKGGGDFFYQENGAKTVFRLRKGGEHFHTNFSQNPVPLKIVLLKIIVIIPAFSQMNTGSTEGNHKDTITVQ